MASNKNQLMLDINNIKMRYEKLQTIIQDELRELHNLSKKINKFNEPTDVGKQTQNTERPPQWDDHLCL